MYVRMMLLHTSEIIIDMQNNPKVSQHKLTLLINNGKLSTLTTILYISTMHLIVSNQNILL